MNFNIESFIFIIVGSVLLIFAKNLLGLWLKFHPLVKPISPWVMRLFYIWPFRIMGIILIILAFKAAPPDSWFVMMKKDVNRIKLLENFCITTGKVTMARRQYKGPEAYSTEYEFYVKDTKNNQERVYRGCALGPKKYYAGLSSDDNVEVIYNPDDPRINCEVRYFLNNPDYRHTFKKAGKLELLSGFRDKYELEDLSYEDWHALD